MHLFFKIPCRDIPKAYDWFDSNFPTWRYLSGLLDETGQINLISGSDKYHISKRNECMSYSKTAPNTYVKQCIEIKELTPFDFLKIKQNFKLVDSLEKLT